MIRCWLVRWLAPELLELVRDEIDLYFADLLAALDYPND